MNRSSSILPSISDVSRSLSESMVRRFVIVFGMICFSTIAVFVVSSAARLSNAVFESSLPHLSALLKVQDSYEYSRQLNSVVETNLMSGFWLYDRSRLLVWSVDREQPHPFDSSVSLQILDGSPSIVTAHTFTNGDEHSYMLVFSSQISPWPFAISFAISAILLYYFANFFRRKMDALANTLSKPLTAFEAFVAETKLDGSQHDFPKHSHGYLEIQNLDLRFDELRADLKERDFKLQSAAKANAIAKTTAMLAHDLKAPLTVVEQVVQIRDWKRFGLLRPKLQSALYRMQTMIDALKKTDIDALVRPEKSLIDVAHLVSELMPLAERFGVLVQVNAQPTWLMADKLKIERAIQNLIVNALESGGKSLRVNASVVSSDYIVEVIDNGPGVDSSIASKLFEQGNTFGKQDGSGLGLSWVMSTARGHGGTAEYKRKDQKTIFTVSLPNCVIQQLEVEEVIPQSHTVQFHPTENTILIAIRSQSLLEKFKEIPLVGLSLVFDLPGADESLRFGAICTDDLEILDRAMDEGIISHFVYENEDPAKTIKMLSKKVAIL